MYSDRPTTLRGDGEQAFETRWMVSSLMITSCYGDAWAYSRTKALRHLFYSIRATLDDCGLRPSDVKIEHRFITKRLRRDYETGEEIPDMWEGLAYVKVKRKGDGDV